MDCDLEALRRELEAHNGMAGLEVLTADEVDAAVRLFSHRHRRSPAQFPRPARQAHASRRALSGGVLQFLRAGLYRAERPDPTDPGYPALTRADTEPRAPSPEEEDATVDGLPGARRGADPGLARPARRHAEPLRRHASNSERHFRGSLVP